MTTVKDAYYRRYRREWVGIFILAGLFTAYRHAVLQKQAVPLYLYRSPAAPTAPTVNWFLMLRMPAITAQYESGIDTMRSRYGQWLEALVHAGYHPMKLSDVSDLLSRGKGVPEKTVVLVFNPGFRRTFRLVEPILAQNQWPAVWMTSEQAMQQGHREYVTYHGADQMVRSGWWDVGFLQNNGTVRLQSDQHGSIPLGDSQHGAWSPIAGGMALNRGTPSSSLNCLNVNSDWTEMDLLNRVRVELPIERRVFLGRASVQNLTWGVTTDQSDSPESRYDLEVASYKRGLVLDWFGTRGIANAQMHAEAKDMIGDFTLRLRWDEERGNGLSVLISKDEVAILEMQAFHVKNTFHLRRDDRRDFSIDLTLQDKDLTVHLDQQAPVRFTLSTLAEPQRGLFQLFLVDRFRGTARARNVQMTFMPL